MTTGLRPVLWMVALAAGLGQGSSARPGPIDRMNWLSGCWEQELPNRRTQEQWMTPLGGTMVGMSRTVVGGKTVSCEYLRIEEQDGRLVYVAMPSGQQLTSFKQVELTDSTATFSNPAHDFPQLIRYRLLADGSLLAEIEGLQDGKSRVEEFPMKRAKCDGPAE